MDNDTLKRILTNIDKDNAVQFVSSSEEKVLVPGYGFYGSKLSRLIFRVVLGNNKTVKRSLIIKEPFLVEDDLDSNNKSNLLKIEVMVNNSVLKEMEYLMEEFENCDDILWCKLLQHEEYSSLFFEDLEAKGFKHIKSISSLDYNHSLLALRNLGRFHGMTKILEERGIIRKEEHSTSCHFFSDESFINNFFPSGLDSLRRGMMKYWGLTWDATSEKLHKISHDVIKKKLGDIAAINESGFNLLNHGDCWVNNMMFKYDYDNKPYTMRLLNFQRSFYNSPCFDVTLFMYLSIDPHLRRIKYDQLLNIYYESLISTLDKYKFEGKRPTYDDISLDMERLSFFGLGLFIVLYAPIISQNTDSSVHLEQFYETDKKTIGIEVYKNRSLSDDMIPDIVSFLLKAES